MKHALFLMLATGFVIAAEVPVAPAPRPVAPRPPAGTVARFAPNPTAISGANADVYSVAVTADGKRIAHAGGAVNPASGFVAVMDVETKKDLLTLKLAAPANAAVFSPDGKSLAYAAADGEFKLIEADTGKAKFGHKLDGAARVAFAPDGKTLATVSATKTVQLWDAATGDERAKLTGAPGRLSGVAFSPDGKRLAVGCTESEPNMPTRGSVAVWDVATEKVTKFESGQGFLFALAFSSDGESLATADNSGVRVWDARTQRERLVIYPASQPVYALAFAPGDRALAGATGNGSVRLWDVSTGDEVAALAGHPGNCRALAFFDDGKRLVSGGGRRSVKVWNVAEKKEAATLRQDERPEDLPIPLAMAATADGSLVALASEEKDVIVRDGATGLVRTQLKGHDDAVTCVAFSPDGKSLATGSADKTLRVWDTATFKPRAVLKGHTNWVYAVAFSPDGKTLASGAYDRTVRIWDAVTGEGRAAIDAHKGSVRAVCFAPDGKTLASAGSDKTVKLWTVGLREPRHVLKGHEGTVRALSFSPDGGTLASGGEDLLVKLWDPVAGKALTGQKMQHTGEVVALAFANNRTVASGSADGSVRIWDTDTGGLASTLSGHGGGVTGLAAVSGGASLISVGQDRIVKRWRQEAQAQGPSRLFAGHTGVVQSVAFSPDGKRFVSCGNWPEGDKTLRVWDFASGQVALKIDHPGEAAQAVFSPDGKFIVSACDDGNAYLWDAETGEHLRPFRGHTAGLNGVAISADGKTLLTSGGDKTVRVWDMATGKTLKTFKGHTAMIRRVAFHPDGKHALSAGRDGVVRLWALDTAKEVRQFKSSGNWADCLAVSADGKFLATGGKELFVYEIETGKKVAQCVGHTLGVTGVAFSKDDKRLLTTSYDYTARLWDRETGRELYRFSDQKTFQWTAVFAPDGKSVLTAGGGMGAGEGKFAKGTDFALRLWRTPDEATLAEFSSGK